MWFLKLLISVLVIPLWFLIFFGYFFLVSKIFKLNDEEFFYSFPIWTLIILFFFLVYDIYINLPF